MSPDPAVEQDRFALALLDSSLPCPPQLRAWNGSDPARRFAVYRNNVVSSLIDALADTFPVAQQLVGIEFFRAMASVFVRRSPPTSRVLAFYGEAMPAFVQAFEPARTVPYLADVMRLEIARVRSYHAADAEALTPQAAAMQLAQHGAIEDFSLVLCPSVQALASPYPVVSIWAAHQTDGEVDLEAVRMDEAQEALVVRQALDVVVAVAPPGTALLVEKMRRGGDFSLAAQASVAAPDGHPAFDLAASLGALIRHGALAALNPKPAMPPDS